MELYVSSRLSNAGIKNALCTEFRNPGSTQRATSLMAKVAHASEGVFLWTELVVKALGSELRKGSDFALLEQTLLDFPIGLDEYFQDMIFNRITKTQRNISDTAAALMLGLQIAESPEDMDNRYMARLNSFINFWLLKNGYLGVGFSWRDFDGK
jgi:hypothetical protein